MWNLRFISSHLLRNLQFFKQKHSFNLQPRTTIARLSSTQLHGYTSSAAQEQKPAPSETVSAIVDEISNLTLLESMDLTEVLRQKLEIGEMPVMGAMMPGMGFPGGAGVGKAAGGKGTEKKEEEKTVFDVKLEGFDAAAKIKVIKEVRAVTDLGLKEAKDLVEKTPTLLKKGVTKEEAEKIIEKLKAAGAKVAME